MHDLPTLLFAGMSYLDDLFFLLVFSMLCVRIGGPARGVRDMIARTLLTFASLLGVIFTLSAAISVLYAITADLPDRPAYITSQCRDHLVMYGSAAASWALYATISGSAHRACRVVEPAEPCQRPAWIAEV